MGFKDIKFPKNIVPDRSAEKVSPHEIMNLILKYATTHENRAYVRLDRYFIEAQDGHWIPAFASGLTLSKEHVARIGERGKSYVDLFILFPEEMVRPAKDYGHAEERTIYDIGMPVGRSRPKLVKLRLKISDISAVFSGRQESKDRGWNEIIYTNSGYIPVPF